ncbi:MAG TPA: aminopeptidase P family N-terminal domain-containing protein, partial [Stellaceae bacterium]|nr:aminopeptidase P family N-terminal domain-containing protein [Stellaceae bacterium]
MVTPLDQAVYDDAETLERLLRNAGSRYGLAELRQLVAGIEAAPEPLDPDAWMVLVAAEPSEPLKAQLRAFRARVARAPHKDTASREEIAARVAALRAELARRGLAGFVVPRADEHQGEYVPARAERLAWITGFTGSAGLAIVLAEKAAVFVDGRYTLQVAQQVDPALFAHRHVTDQPPDGWIADNLPAGDRLGYDPWLHTPEGLEGLRRAVARAGGELVSVADNPLDAVWEDQPAAPIAPVRPHPVRFAGREAGDKRVALGAKLAEGGVDAAVLTAPDSLAWLLNIRGGDVPRTPLPLGFAILHASGAVDLFMDQRKFVPGLEAHLGNAVTVHAPEALGAALDR